MGWITNLQGEGDGPRLPDLRSLPFLLVVELPILRNLDPAKIQSSKKIVCPSRNVDAISDALMDLVKNYSTKRSTFD